MATSLETDLKIIKANYGRGIVCNLFSSFPDFIICCGIALGLYSRWIHYGYILIFALALCGLFIFSTNLALRYYFSVNYFNPLFHVWLTTTLCLIGLWDDFRLSSPQKHLDDLVNVFFIAGSVSHFVVQTFFLICKTKVAKDGGLAVMTVNDYGRILGMAVACFAAGTNVLPLLHLVLVIFVNLIAIKLKSITAILNLFAICALTEAYIFPSLNLSINPYAIICALLRLFNKPILELFIILPSVTRLDRYSGIILSRKIFLRLLILIYILFELDFFYFHAKEIKNHKEWYVVVPMFIVVSIFWLLTKILVVIVLHNLVKKFYQCKLCLMTDGMMNSDSVDDITFSLKKILAAKGLRYFGLVAQKLVYVSILATFLIAAICWTTFNPYNYPLTSIVFALQILLCELLNEFTFNIGGTCVGYAAVVPVAITRSDNFVSVLPQQFVHNITLRSTACVDSIVKFFGQHLIQNFGCDLSTSGLDWTDMRKKLASFFVQSTAEGPPYDTYVLYYSGPVNDKGDWAMTGNTVVSLEDILELWRESSSSATQQNKHRKSSRLIIICDCDHSDQWLKSVQKLTDGDFIGLQTYCINGRMTDATKPTVQQHDSELVDVCLPPSIGDFTRLWVEYNGPSSGNRSLFDTLSPDLHPRYQVSKSWSDFRFARPDSEDICDYWRNYLPRFTHRTLGFIVTIINAPPILPDGFTDYVTCLHFFKRWRMKFFPPAELDTGHGFKLVKF